MIGQAKNLPGSLLLVGGGKMGGAMLEGWLRVGLRGAAATVIEPHPGPELQQLCAAKGVALNPARDTIAPPEALVLAIKPQVLGEVGPEVAPLVDSRTTLISVLAGKTIADLDAAIPGCGGIVRSIPNLPAAIAQGATGACTSPGLDEARRAMADALLNAIGVVAWVEDEGLIDACTAVSGSGPAYVFLLAEELARAGVDAGLPEELAQKLARATVAGAGAMLAQSPLPSGTLRENVTSKGGTTAAALEVLMAENGFRPLLRDAVAAAKRRAGELSG
ncbi:MAG: pyrroline-5-carboxylate reductase [Salinarimonas sp.]|nr:pyrroline-5-carboxylate reductase [Salinarimonas sp.]